MDFTEHTLAQLRRDLTMCEHGPVGARDLALSIGFVPRRRQCCRIMCCREGLERVRMPMVERLVQRLGRITLLARQRNRVVMNVQIARALHADEAGHQFAQLGCAHAGADHRAVQIPVQLRKLGPHVSGRRARVKLLMLFTALVLVFMREPRRRRQR